MVNFPTKIPDCDSHSPALLDLFISSDASIYSTTAFPPLGNSDHVVVSVSIDFLSLKMRCPISLHSLSLFHGRISLNSVLLLLLVNFVSGFRMESMHICLIVSIRSSLTHLHGFELFVLLP